MKSNAGMKVQVKVYMNPELINELRIHVAKEKAIRPRVSVSNVVEQAVETWLKQIKGKGERRL